MCKKEIACGNVQIWEGHFESRLSLDPEERPSESHQITFFI